MSELSLWRHGQLVTLAGDTGYGLIDDGTLVVEGERIAWVGADAVLPPGAAEIGRASCRERVCLAV